MNARIMATSSNSTSPALSPLSPEKPQGIRKHEFVHPSEGQNWLDAHQRWLESHGLPEDGFLESHRSPSDHQRLPIPQRVCEISQGIRNIVSVESFEYLCEHQLQPIDHQRLCEFPNVLSEKSQGTHSHAIMKDENSVDLSESQQDPEISFGKSLAVIMMTVN